MKKGCVSLVGAGPGDPELLTLKALKRIREADLIIYDTLANTEHLAHAKKTAVCLCVGRGFRHKKWSQDKINRRILSEARKGKYVVRLKGGDPYLFGRGGEEALFLVDHKIPFQVIPGVTSANGCAAYAGIPLTHRDHNASVTFLTGHRAHDEHLDSVDWRRIVSLEGTLAIYMGFYNLKKITERLKDHGMSAQMPVAVVEWGTLPRQRTCEGTLQNIARIVQERRLKAPCMIIVGEVVRLRKKLNWFEQLPLFGKKVVLTRMQEKAGPLADKFRSLGASVTQFPTIEIEKKPNTRSMDQAIRSLWKYDWAVFSSSYGVEAFFERLTGRGRDARELKGLKIASVGPETAKALHLRGIVPDLVPSRYETGTLTDELKARGSLKGKRFLLLRTDIAPVTLENKLRSSGARVDSIIAYRTRRVKISKTSIKNFLLNPPDFITFTSGSSAANFVRAMGLKNMKKISKKSVLASIGPVTSRTLKGLGLKVGCQARAYHTDGLVEAVERSVERRT